LIPPIRLSKHRVFRGSALPSHLTYVGATPAPASDQGYSTYPFAEQQTPRMITSVELGLALKTQSNDKRQQYVVPSKGNPPKRHNPFESSLMRRHLRTAESGERKSPAYSTGLYLNYVVAAPNPRSGQPSDKDTWGQRGRIEILPQSHAAHPSALLSPPWRGGVFLGIFILSHPLFRNEYLPRTG